MQYQIMTITPKYIDENIKKFCNSIRYKSSPIFINIEPQKGSKIKDCVNNVQRYIEKNGGRAVNGWAIWLLPKFLLEAEFHVIYESKNLELIDITPHENNTTRVLFLPDDTIEYKNCQIKTKLKNISKSKLGDNYIKNFDVIFNTLNKGKRKYNNGKTFIPKDEFAYCQYLARENKNILEKFYLELTIKPNEPCICGSNLKYVDCCKRK